MDFQDRIAARAMALFDRYADLGDDGRVSALAALEAKLGEKQETLSQLLAGLQRPCVVGHCAVLDTRITVVRVRPFRITVDVWLVHF